MSDTLNIHFEPRKPSLTIEVRYHRKAGGDNESVGISWKGRGPQPSMKALPKSDQHQLLDLLLRLSRSAFPKAEV